jgi:hypothetical protein
MEEYMQNNLDFAEYKDALESFRSTNQAQAEAHYADLKGQNRLINTYDKILEKFHKICALPQKLASYIDTPTIDQTNDIIEHCRSILNDHERTDYNPLFKTSKYFDNAGFQCQPEYGRYMDIQ